MLGLRTVKSALYKWRRKSERIAPLKRKKPRADFSPTLAKPRSVKTIVYIIRRKGQYKRFRGKVNTYRPCTKECCLYWKGIRY